MFATIDVAAPQRRDNTYRNCFDSSAKLGSDRRPRPSYSRQLLSHELVGTNEEHASVSGVHLDDMGLGTELESALGFQATLIKV